MQPSLSPLQDGHLLLNADPAINCWVTITVSLRNGALSARTPISRSGLVLESMHEYPRFLHRYSRQADSSSGEQHGTHPESHLLRACPVQEWLSPTLSCH